MRNGVEDTCERLDAGEMLACERLQLDAPVVCESEVQTPLVALVAHALQQARRFGSLSQLDGTVVANVEQLCRVADRRSSQRWVAAYDEQQLMERWREAGIVRRLLTPAQEVAQLGAEREQALVVAVVQPPG